MGNWGLLIDNNSNQPIRLHLLMDFNHSFKEYDNLEGERCLTVKAGVTQRQAAIDAAGQLGEFAAIKRTAVSFI